MAVDRLEELLAKQRQIIEAVQPVDVPVLLGDDVVTVRIPHLGKRFDALAEKHSPNIMFRDAAGCWFNADALARDYPDVLLIDGEQQDDLYVLRNKTAVYRWGEIYDALSGEDKGLIISVIWGMYIGEPAERKRKAVANG
ncbi:hypothetical protein [Microbacterium sp.]|uniref:hypothetical protein n=1 Tax=Microbacterium sp. TaxID=51671 RepID=UPI003C738730